jgi:hypothetical protein
LSAVSGQGGGKAGQQTVLALEDLGTGDQQVITSAGTPWRAMIAVA